MRMWSYSKISFFLCLVKIKRIRRQSESKVPMCNTSDESFSSDLLRNIMNYWTESHLESCQTSTLELFYKNSQRPKDVNYFRKKAPSQMFDWIPNAFPIGKVQ